ncbi:Type-4 ice-structuring protein LS-12 [Channa argus]|uniref:Type-4 ice-structuring protein LS-12 n=2 Tax=Channa argus TaxID=215402 RepID=A0A6G1PQ04_CHAAH|nr:Type-4 ice-structuring protein LS-12 [Channa argus]
MSLVKRDVQSEVDRITKIINDMSASITSATQEMVEKVKALEVTNTAQTYMEDSKTQFQPLVERVQAEAAKLQEQIKPFVTDIEDQFKPLSDMMEQFFQQVVDQTKALLPSQ